MVEWWFFVILCAKINRNNINTLNHWSKKLVNIAKGNRMTMTKIDDEGHYTKFPGITVISNIRDEDLSFWVKIYNCLASDELLTEYFSPLPCFSYHMTTTNLFVQADYSKKQWEKLLTETSPLFMDLIRLLSNHEFSPEIRFGEIITGGVIQLEVSLPAKQEALIRSIAKTIGMERSVPYFFHITLAYKFKSPPAADEDIIQARLQERLGLILAGKPKGLKLNPPQLCSFHDMTAFVPWDGSILSLFPSRHLSHAFFSKDETSVQTKVPGFKQSLK